LFQHLWKGWIAVKKLIGSLILLVAVVVTTVGCGEEPKKGGTTPGKTGTGTTPDTGTKKTP
jgi:hypothetical protein